LAIFSHTGGTGVGGMAVAVGPAAAVGGSVVGAVVGVAAAQALMTRASTVKTTNIEYGIRLACFIFLLSFLDRIFQQSTHFKT
jgi:hypothetical protein